MTEDGAATSAVKKDTEYRVFQSVVGHRNKVLEQLAKVLADAGEVSVLVLVDVSSGSKGPKALIKDTVVAKIDLDGDYTVAASGAFTDLPGLKSKMERTVQGL